MEVPSFSHQLDLLALFLRSESLAHVPGGFGSRRWPGSWRWRRGFSRVKPPPALPHKPPPMHLIFDVGGRNDLLYATPQQLLDMMERDPAELKLRFKQALDHFHENGRLRPSDLQLPIRLSPYDTAVHPLTGYHGGEFDPGRLGVACIVVPPTEGRGSNSKGTYSLNPVPTLSLT